MNDFRLTIINTLQCQDKSVILTQVTPSQMHVGRLDDHNVTQISWEPITHAYPTNIYANIGIFLLAEFPLYVPQFKPHCFYIIEFFCLYFTMLII